MRPLVRTHRQARQRLQAAFNATGDVIAAAQRDHKLLPNRCLHHVVLSRSRLRAALADLNSENSNR